MSRQRQMRFLVRIVPAPDVGDTFSPTVKRVASTLGVRASNPKWTSYGALEIDLFGRAEEDIRLCLAALEPLGRIEFAKNLEEAPPYRTTEDAIRVARDLFNAERYWESHEVLEGVWRNMAGKDKLYVQGVILVCAAFVHHQKGEEAVALGVLRRAERQLSNDKSDFFGISTSSLERQVRRVLEQGTFKPFPI